MNTELIEKLIVCADKHRAADEYIAGQYEWEGGACAIGCAISDVCEIEKIDIDPDDHTELAKIADTPEVAWRMIDSIFEGLPEAERPSWPGRALRAMAQMKTPETLATRIALWCCSRGTGPVWEELTRLYTRRLAGDEPDKLEWDAVYSQAVAASSQADAARYQADAARYQAEAARSQADARSAYSQAKTVYSQAFDAAYSQADAVYSQADAVYSQAFDAVYSQYWRDFAGMLCEEMAK